jgi:hypothetical protein
MRPEVERLRLLTLTLEQALGAEDWPQVQALLDERDRHLEALEKSSSTIRQSDWSDAELRCLTELRRKREAIVAELQESSRRKSMVTAYRASHEPSEFNHGTF